MSLFDYMPHRMLINRSLCKAADELREHIDEYQAEYDRRVAVCEARIKETEEDLSKEREIILAILDKELDEAEGELSLIYDDLASYVDLFLYLGYLRKIKQIRKSQIDIHNEDIAFLGNQMRLIGEEIEILEAREAELTSLASIDDIVNLANMTPPGLDLDSSASCKELLERITAMLGELPDDRRSEIFALRRLRVIVQERSDYADSIKYIEWIIRQKKQFSAQLSAKRKDVCASRADARSLLHRVEKEIDETNRKLNKLAEAVRMHWVRPIVYLSADISYAYQQKSDAIARLNDVRGDIDHMKRMHSSDQWKWDRLQREREDLVSEIDNQQEIIDEKKVLRGEWHGKRRSITRLCGENNVPLRSDGEKGRRDQKKLISIRLDEIQQIRVLGIAEAEAKCEEERRVISQERAARLQEINDQIGSIEEEIRESESAEAHLREDVAVVSQNLKSVQASDTRFVMFRLLAESAEVARAKSALRQAQSRLHAIVEKRASVVDRREDKKVELAEATSDYEKRLSRCQPHYLRPTADERLEEEKLQLLMRELEDGRQGGMHR